MDHDVLPHRARIRGRDYFASLFSAYNLMSLDRIIFAVWQLHVASSDDILCYHCHWNTMALTSTVLLLLILASRCQKGILKDVFASSAHLKMLNVEEGNLIEAVKSYISHERVRIQSLERSDIITAFSLQMFALGSDNACLYAYKVM